MSENKNLLPISELMPQRITQEAVPTEESQTVKSEKTRILHVFDVEVKKIISTQEKNKEEIEKRQKDIKTLTDNNLVLMGALSAIQKLRSEV